MKREYNIIQPTDDLISGGEILDTGDFGRIGRAKFNGANPEAHCRGFSPIFFIAGIFLVSVLAYTGYLQLIKNQFFVALIDKNTQLLYSIQPPRGVIFDIRGEPLALNTPEYNVLLLPPQLPDTISKRKEVIHELGAILALNPQTLEELIKQKEHAAIFVLARGVTKEQSVALESKGLAGVIVQIDSRRKYTDPEIFSHIIGYVGEVTPENIEDNLDYILGDVIGKSGIERQYNSFLRGARGTINFYGGEKKLIQPSNGNDIVLNINAALQRLLYDSLNKFTRESGAHRASALIQNVHTGAIQALVSLPSYDNNIFISGENNAKYNTLISDHNRPLFNRAIAGLFSPGSIIKPLIAASALEEKIIDPREKILSTGSISLVSKYDPARVHIFRDWRAHGWVDMRDAIAFSSDEYFYTVGGGHDAIKGLGISKIARYLKIFFADRKLGLDMPGEKSGFVPTPDWKLKNRDEYWYQGDTYNVSIGQGDLLVTPLWLNSYTAMIANGGTLYRPRLYQKIIDAKTGGVIQESHKEALVQDVFSSSSLSVVREGMRRAVTNGTARILNTLPISAAAKTGTAEVIKGKTNNALFTAFAPYEDPEIAITVLIENGGQGSDGPAKVVYYILRNYFGKNL